MQIYGYHIERGTITNDRGATCTEQPFTWLVEESSKDTIQVFYHLDWAVAELLHMAQLTEEEGKKLLSTGSLYLAPWTIRYIPGRILTLDKGFGPGHPFAMFGNAHQYQYSEQSPSDCPETLCSRARRAAEVGATVYHTLTSLGLRPKSLTSPVSVFQKEILNNLNLPTIDDLPEEAAEWAYECCTGSWLEAFKRGHFLAAHDYDIRGAYPYQLSLLMDTRQGRWLHDPNYPADCVYGVAKCKVYLTDTLHPILVKDTQDNSFTPTGVWETPLTLSEIRYLGMTGNRVDLIDGYWWTPKSRVSRPLLNIIRNLYQQAQATTGLPKEVIKRIMTGTYGKLIEVYQHNDSPMGDLFNPFWASIVEANTRLRVAAALDSQYNKAIHIAVDGILANKPLHFNKEELTSQQLGGWRISSVTNALVFGSGSVALQEKQGTGDFALNYDEILTFMQNNPQSTSYTMTKLSPITLAKALNDHRWPDLGQLAPTSRTISFAYESKRLYPHKLETAQDFLTQLPADSTPWDISLIKRRQSNG